MKILFLTEGGAGRGSGHVIRSFAIAEALSALGTESDFVIDCPEDFQSPISFRRLQWQTESGDLRGIISKEHSGIFVDSYTVKATQLRRIASLGLPMFYLDDLQAVEFPMGTIFSPFPQKPYFKKPGRVICTGADYIPLRKAFAQLKPAALENREGILVTFGGSPQNELIYKVLDALSGCKEKITLVADGFSRDGVKVLSTQTAENMAALMSENRVMICAGGGTLNEAARAGIPAIVVKIADNQNQYTAFWQKAGSAFLAGNKEDKDLCPAIQTYLEKLSDKTVWLQASGAGALCDGKGAGRIASVMVRQITAAAKSVLLKKDYRITSCYLKNYTNCNEIEAKRILEARNHQSVRQSNTNPLPMGQLMWKSFLKSLATSTSSGYWLVFDGLEAAGSFSLTAVNQSEGGAVLGFYKNPDFKGKAVGQLLCKLAAELAFSKLGLSYITAECFENNPASRKSLERAGFSHCFNSEDSKGRVIMHYELMNLDDTRD